MLLWAGLDHLACWLPPACAHACLHHLIPLPSLPACLPVRHAAGDVIKGFRVEHGKQILPDINQLYNVEVRHVTSGQELLSLLRSK